MFRIAVLASGGGTDLQSIIDSVENKTLQCEIALVATDRNCHALERATKHNIPNVAIPRKNFWADFETYIADKNIDLIVLAGFLTIVSSDFIKKWHRKIINIHPSLLPKHGGKGMYGIHVHEDVLVSGDTVSGCTVHYVDETVDGGEIIIQRQVPVLPDDTPETLQQRVLVEEHILLPQAIQMIIDGK